MIATSERYVFFFMTGIVKRKVLVLDLDETLIHSHHDGVVRQTVRPGTPPDFVLKVVIDRHPVRFFVHKRPHVDFFLDIVSLSLIWAWLEPRLVFPVATLFYIQMFHNWFFLLWSTFWEKLQTLRFNPKFLPPTFYPTLLWLLWSVSVNLSVYSSTWKRQLH